MKFMTRMILIDFNRVVLGGFLGLQLQESHSEQFYFKSINYSVSEIKELSYRLLQFQFAYLDVIYLSEAQLSNLPSQLETKTTSTFI